MSDSFATPCSVGYQAPLSIGFPRQEYWNWLPFPSPEELANPEIEPVTPTLAGRFFTIWATRKAHSLCQAHIFSDPSRSVSLFLDLKMKVKSLSHVWLFATPWTVAYQAPQSTGFSRQEYWSGLPFPSPGDLPHQGSNPGLLHYRQMLCRLSHQGSSFLELSVQSSSCLLALPEHSVQSSTSCLSFLYTWIYFLHRICHQWI